MRNAPDSPSHVILVGPMGAGKTVVGRLLAARLQRGFIDLDAQIESGTGMSIRAIFGDEGEAGFRRHEREALLPALARPDAAVIATGGGAVLDAGNRASMRAAGRVVYLQVDPATQWRRIADCSDRPLLATDEPARRLADLQAVREPLYQEVSDLTFDTSGHSPEAAADALVALLDPASERCA